MTTQLLERPVKAETASVRMTGSPLHTRVLIGRVLQRLESWLPAEEQRLSGARAEGDALLDDEAHWQAMLRLYERLTISEGGRSSVAA